VKESVGCPSLGQQHTIRCHKTNSNNKQQQHIDRYNRKNTLYYIFIIMDGIPTPIISGTIAYLVLGLVGIGGVFGSRASGMLSKDNAEIGNVVITLSVFAMWLFWLCAWMHQWHPLIAPIYEG
jgi:V-type H+-transporting ATPase subunit e